LSFSIPVLSQKSKPKNMVLADFQKFHFGYSVGFGTSAFVVTPKDGYHIDLRKNPLININLITDYRLNKYMDIRFVPGIQFTQRDLSVTNKITHDSLGWPIESVFVDLPILFKYRAERVNNYAPYLIAGVNPRFDLIGAKLEGWKPATRMVKSFDFNVELGVGVDFYLSMVKVAMELKFSVGTRDIYMEIFDPKFELYTSGINNLYSRMIVLAFHVEQSQ
jgi:hypothetical protein